MIKKQQKMAKKAKNGFKLTFLIAPTILELEIILLNKIFCSNIKLRMLLYKLPQKIDPTRVKKF